MANPTPLARLIRMTKADLVGRVSESLGPSLTKRDIARVVDSFLDAVKDTLTEGENIEIRGFGTFKVKERKPRPARNPRTGEQVLVPARPTAVFKPAKELKSLVEAQ